MTCSTSIKGWNSLCSCYQPWADPMWLTSPTTESSQLTSDNQTDIIKNLVKILSSYPLIPGRGGYTGNKSVFSSTAGLSSIERTDRSQNHSGTNWMPLL